MSSCLLWSRMVFLQLWNCLSLQKSTLRVPILNESVYNVWKKLRMVENPLKSQYGLLQRKDVTFWGSISRIRGVNITIISATFFLLLLQKMSSKDSLICYVQQLVFKSTTKVCFSKDKLRYRKAGPSNITKNKKNTFRE